jgi:phytanoyl-CoA hydroxylase
MGRIKEDGFVLIKKAFDVSEVAKDIRGIFEAYHSFEEEFDVMAKSLFAKDNEGFVGCANSAQYLTSLMSLASSKDMVEILKLNDIKMPVINTRPLLSFSSKDTAKNENYWRVPSHQDWPSMQGSINSVTCWLALVDVTEDMGPLQISPRSHLCGRLDHLDNGVPLLDEYQGEFQSFPMDAGDMLVFNTFTVHRSGTNSSEKIRLSAHFRYDDCLEPSFIKRKYPRHRIEKRKEGLLFPDFPSEEEVRRYFGG